MSTHFKIEGVPPFDGEHPLDLSYFTNRELHTIKRISGVRAGGLQEAMAAEDSDLLVAFAIIALLRAGKDVPQQAEDLLWDAPIGAMILVADEPVEDDAGPPVLTPESGPGESVSTTSSGASSNGDAANLENDPSRTGHQHSGIGVT